MQRVREVFEAQKQLRLTSRFNKLRILAAYFGWPSFISCAETRFSWEACSRGMRKLALAVLEQTKEPADQMGGG